MYAALSPEVRGQQMVRDLGVSAAFVSALTGIEQTKLSRAFRQLKPLSNAEGMRLTQTLLTLIQLRDALAPLQLDLKNPANTRLVMGAFEGHDIETIRKKISMLFE